MRAGFLQFLKTRAALSLDFQIPDSVEKEQLEETDATYSGILQAITVVFVFFLSLCQHQSQEWAKALVPGLRHWICVSHCNFPGKQKIFSPLYG